MSELEVRILNLYRQVPKPMKQLMHLSAVLSACANEAPDTTNATSEPPERRQKGGRSVGSS